MAKQEIEYEDRKFLMVGGKVEGVLHDLKVAIQPCKSVCLAAAPVAYWFYECIYNGKAMFLERRIEETEDGQDITETIIENLPN